MDQRPPVAMGARTAAGGLTLAVHGLLVTVLLLEDQDLQRPLPASRALAQVWIHLTSMQVPAMDEPLVRETRASLARAIPPRVDESPLAPPPATRPSGAIELDRAPSPVDWDLMAQRRAGTFGEEGKPATFGPPVAKLREPCKPWDSSFEWSPAEEKAGFFPLPYVTVGESCVIGLGFFACSLGTSPPNRHLFDDMQHGRTPDSSVPDPDFCD